MLLETAFFDEECLMAYSKHKIASWMFSKNKKQKRTLFLAKQSFIKVIITIRRVNSQKLKNQ